MAHSPSDKKTATPAWTAAYLAALLKVHDLQWDVERAEKEAREWYEEGSFTKAAGFMRMAGTLCRIQASALDKVAEVLEG